MSEPDPEKLDQINNAVSRKLLLQLGLRAIRRVHLEAQLLSLGHKDDDPANLIRRINQGSGVQAALESAVHEALAQEYNSSKLAHGWKRRANAPDGEGSHYYGFIERQVAYQIRSSTKRFVDLQYRRVPGPSEDQGVVFPVAPVELKRARTWTPNLQTGTPLRDAENQAEEVADDVRKLARFVRADRAHRLNLPASLPARELIKDEHGNPADRLQPQILVWGEDSDKPNAFMNEVSSAVKKCGCRLSPAVYEWAPVSWQGKAQDDVPTVTKWIWVGLASVLVLGPSCKEKTCECQEKPERRRSRDQKKKS